MNCNCGAATCALVSYMDDILDERGVIKSHKELEILLKCLWKVSIIISKLEYVHIHMELNDCPL